MKRALISGIAGQDGSYLSELLLSKGYEVHGIELPLPEGTEGKLSNIHHVGDRLHLHFGCLTDNDWSLSIVKKVNPDECYHLAASTFVSYSDAEEGSILANNILSTHSLLAALKQFSPKCKLFFAGSAEMFGDVKVSPQNEITSFNPRSVYGISKVAGHHLVKYYRQHHGLFSCSGIMYNHESPRRAEHFVTRKITTHVAKIKLGLENKLLLGNLDAVRDWRYAPDYVMAMWLMLQQEIPRDYVLATGKLHSVRDFVEVAFRCTALDYRDFVEIDSRFYRDVELVPLCGSPIKAERDIGWNPSKDFKEIVSEMVAHDLTNLMLHTFCRS